MVPHVVVVSVIEYLVSSHRGISPAQRLFRKKSGELLELAVPMRDFGAAPQDSTADR